MYVNCRVFPQKKQDSLWLVRELTLLASWCAQSVFDLTGDHAPLDPLGSWPLAKVIKNTNIIHNYENIMYV